MQVMGTVWPEATLVIALRLVFQSLLCEEREETAGCFQRVWAALLRCCDPPTLTAAARPCVGAWCGLLATPVRPRRPHTPYPHGGVTLDLRFDLALGFVPGLGSRIEYGRNVAVSPLHSGLRIQPASSV